MFPLWYSKIYTDGISPEATFPRTRYRAVRALLGSQDAGNSIIYHEPAATPVEDLLLAHETVYVESFLSGSLDKGSVRRIGLRPWTEAIVERTLVLTNGTISAMRHAVENGGFAGNLGGGTHHAYAAFGSGYCIFNDLAISALVARRDYGISRILILDLDVHQGDGTAQILENDPDIRTVSFHCGTNFPFRKMTSDIDVEFAPGTTDDEYLSTLESFLQRDPPLFEPELILFQAGVDGLDTDKLGQLSLSHEGLRRRNEMVFSLASGSGIPVVVTMGGGYSDPLTPSVEAHADLFLQAARDGA